MQKRLLSRREVEQYLNIGYTTFCHLVEFEGLPAFKIGERWKVGRDELEDWVCKQHSDACIKRLERARRHYVD